MIIEARELVKEFNGLRAVKGVSFSVNEEEIFGFLGPNGAGKTTTINMLCTLLKPTSGTAILNGYDVIKKPNEVRRSIGLVFQDPSLDERLTAKDNLNFHALIYGIPKRERKRRIAEVLEMVELADRQNDIVRTFSGGMKRRLEIARGLLHYPKILFLDEPTLGLDPQTRSRIWEYIKDLRKKEKITIFLTTHYMDEAEVCDRIAIIDYGKIIALNTPKKLKKQIGGSVVTITTARNELAKKLLKERFSLEAIETNNSLRFEVKEGEKFIPQLVKRLGVEILSVELHLPTLDDVFLKLTGRAIREETVSKRELMRKHWRRR